MPAKRILAFSSSRVGKSGYLETVVPVVKKFLGYAQLNIAFVPFASLGSAEEYISMVSKAFAAPNLSFKLIDATNGLQTLNSCNAIMIGGGNTFKLLHDLYAFNLLEVIKSKVENGVPYIGWSAGSNITGQTISTTNDMPIIEPASFKALNFYPFQLNPHYINEVIDGHNGETRDQRLIEFCTLNPTVPIVGLPEGTFLQLENNVLVYKGISQGSFFINNGSSGTIKSGIEPSTNLSYLLLTQ